MTDGAGAALIGAADPDPRTGQIDVEVYWELRS